MTERPLTGRRIVITRSPKQAKVLAEKLEKLGGIPLVFPVIRFEPLFPPQLADALARLASFDWLVFTSVNAAQFFLNQVDLVPESLPKIAAVGSATADQLERLGFAIDFMPDSFTGEHLARGLGDLMGQEILLPRAKIGRPDIVTLLQEQGAVVHDIPLYDTVTATPTAEMWAQLQAGFDLLTFTSPSSVRNFVKIVRRDSPELLPAISHCPTAVIGPVTADAVTQQNLKAPVVPTEYTIQGLIDVSIHLFSQ